jgi:alkylhydroperoxidase family enzyme
VIGLTVSFENACPWSMVARSTFAAAQGTSAAVLAALRSGRELPDTRLEALHAFTRRLLGNRGHLDADEVQALGTAGYTSEQALEVIAWAACTSMANWAANLADPPVDTSFQPQRWQAVAEAAVRQASKSRRPRQRPGPRPPPRRPSRRKTAWP